MRDTRIVRAGEGDLAIIERLARLTWPDTFRGILSTDQLEYMLDRMYRPEALAEQCAMGHVFHLLLATERSSAGSYAGQGTRYRPVGYVSHELDYLPFTTKIHKLYVLPGAQGRGYGRMVVEKVRNIADRAGQTKLRLDVNYQNKAVDFYERLGFNKVARHDTDIGNGYLMEDWQMEKVLS